MTALKTKNKNCISPKGSHLWGDVDGITTGGTGYDGIRVCRKCGSSWQSQRESSDDAETHDWMKDCHGKRVPKKDWFNCKG